MISKYQFLKKYIHPKGKAKGKVIEIGRENVFYPINENAIEDAEQRLDFQFPTQLREFYLEIGHGHLTTPENPPAGYTFCGVNEILHPNVIADNILLGHDSGYISEDGFELMKPGDLPFFRIVDSCFFLMMKLNSRNPNAIYNQKGDLVEENFNRFIWRLYYESPIFYEEAQLFYKGQR